MRLAASLAMLSFIAAPVLAQDTVAKAIWLANCIENGLDCSGGDLGDGQQLIGATQPSYGWTNPNPREALP